MGERSEYFLDQCRKMHGARKTLSGRGVLKHRPWLLTIAQEIGAKSALDYGCGKGAQFEEIGPDGKTLEQALGFKVSKYDPCWPDFAKAPAGQFDLVWCTDVLEYVPEEDISATLQKIGALATKAVFITVATYPAKKTLPDGTNAHVTIKPAMWWGTKFAAMRRAFPGLRVEVQIA